MQTTGKVLALYQIKPHDPPLEQPSANYFEF